MFDLDKIKNLRGILYRKWMKKEPEPPKTRAGHVLFNLKRAGSQPRFRLHPARSLLVIPAVSDLKMKSLIYPVIKPYAYVNIKHDDSLGELVYNVIEPTMGENETKVLERIKDGLVQVIDVSISDIKDQEKLIEFLEENVQRLVDEFNFQLNEKEYLKIMYYIYRDFVGLNRIEVMMNDPYVEDIGCDGTNIPVYIVHQKFGSVRTNILYKEEEELREFVIKLAERSDRYISYAEPLLDGTLKDGSRVQASLAGDVTTSGPTFSIRKFKDVPFSPVDMLHLGTVSADMLAYLWFVVENGANILIAGGVSTGKTSILNTISLFIPHEAKIVSIEDTRELNLPHENWIPGVARSGFTGTGVGEVTMFELLKESFRQNPDYLIVGEVRGKEAYVMFQGMASGHPSVSTMHAGSVDDVLRRLQTKPINLSRGLLASLDLVIIMVHAREKGKSARRVKEIVEIEDIDPVTGTPRTNKAFLWLPADDSFEYKGNSWLLNKISAEKGFTLNKVISDISRRKKMINWMFTNNITDLTEIIKYINLYQRDPEKVSLLLDGRITKEGLADHMAGTLSRSVQEGGE